MIVTLKSLTVRNSKKLWKILRVQELRLVIFVILHLNKCSVTVLIYLLNGLLRQLLKLGRSKYLMGTV